MVENILNIMEPKISLLMAISMIHIDVLLVADYICFLLSSFIICSSLLSILKFWSSSLLFESWFWPYIVWIHLCHFLMLLGLHSSSKLSLFSFSSISSNFFEYIFWIDLSFVSEFCWVRVLRLNQFFLSAVIFGQIYVIIVVNKVRIQIRSPRASDCIIILGIIFAIWHWLFQICNRVNHSRAYFRLWFVSVQFY